MCKDWQYKGILNGDLFYGTQHYPTKFQTNIWNSWGWQAWWVNKTLQWQYSLMLMPAEVGKTRDAPKGIIKSRKCLPNWNSSTWVDRFATSSFEHFNSSTVDSCCFCSWKTPYIWFNSLDPGIWLCAINFKHTLVTGMNGILNFLLNCPQVNDM